MNLSRIARAVFDEVKVILYFPLWWYTCGLILWFKGCGRAVGTMNARLGFTVWLFNIFTPMYGQTDFMGRLISFFMRVVNVLLRGILMAIGTVVLVAVALLWPVAPVIIVMNIFYFF